MSFGAPSLSSRRKSTRRSAVSQAARLTLESLETRRMLSAGDPDLSFGGGDGFIVENFGGQSISAGPTLVQQDGKIVSIGLVDNTVALARFNADGSIDDSFANPSSVPGEGGLFTQAAGDVLFGVVGVEELSDHSLVVAGNALNNDFDFFVIVVSPDGLSSFLVNPQSPGDQSAGAIATDGTSVYVVGSGHDDVGNVDNVTLLQKFSKDTQTSVWGYDTGFSDDGKVAVDISTLNDFPDTPRALVLDGSGFIVGGDYLSQNGEIISENAIARLDATGGLDTNFGADQTGVVPTYLGGFSSIHKEGSQLLVTGNTGDQLIVQRYVNGVLDATFGGGDGITEFTLTDPEQGLAAGSINVDGAGNIVVSATLMHPDSSSDIAVVRFDSSGTIDSDFGTAGFTTISVGDTAAAGNIFAVPGSEPGAESLVVGGGTFTAFVVTKFINAEPDITPPPSPVVFDAGTLTITGTEAADTIVLSKNAAGQIKVNFNGTLYGPFAVTNRIQIAGNGGDDVVTVATGITLGADISGGAGNDSLTGGGGNDSIDGGADNDVITGRAGNDTAVGGSGNDHISNAAGDDQLEGNAGDDTLIAGGGNDVVHGNAGNDSILGGVGNDSLYGDEDNDTINGGDGDDVIDGGLGADDLNGQGGSDIVLGGDGNDIVQGAGLRDILIGGNGSDSVLGNAEDDVLVAGYTSIDTNIAQLQAALAAWNSADPYAARVSNLQTNYFQPANITDNDSDTLTGGAGNDWFVYDTNGGTPDTVDKKTGESVTDVL